MIPKTSGFFLSVLRKALVSSHGDPADSGCRRFRCAIKSARSLISPVETFLIVASNHCHRGSPLGLVGRDDGNSSLQIPTPDGAPSSHGNEAGGGGLATGTYANVFARWLRRTTKLVVRCLLTSQRLCVYFLIESISGDRCPIAGSVWFLPAELPSLLFLAELQLSAVLWSSLRKQ